VTGFADWIIGGFLVFLYAHGRFNSPATNIGSTTLFRFHLAACLYYAAAMLLFGFLSVLLSDSPQIVEGLLIDGDANMEKLKALSSPILAALLMTALLPNTWGLSKVDAWLLHRFQDLGNIPSEVRFWRDRLAASKLRIPEKAIDAIRRKLSESPLFSSVREDNLRFEDDDSPQYRFTRLIYLMSVVDGFKIAPGKYPRLLAQFEDEYLAIRQRFEKAIMTATRYFGVMAAYDDADSATPAIVELKRSFREHCEDANECICQLLARGILRSELTQLDRSRKLEALGFESFEETATKLDPNKILTVLCVVFLILLSGIALIKGRGELTGALYIASMVTVIYGAAVVCALAPKLGWRHADVAELGDRPVWSYLLSGALGVGSAIVVSIVFKSFNVGFLAALGNIRFTWPWYVLTFCVAATLALFCDNWGGRSTREPRWGRYAEGLGLGVLLSGAFLLTQALFREIPDLDPDRIPKIHVIPVIFLIGFFLGAFVPSWYRSTRTPPPR